jgi:Protein of unknown function (DUF4197)
MTMTIHISRRALIATAAAAPFLALPGCAGTGFSLVDAIRELLSLSSQRAFAQLLRQNGFFDDQLARIDLPEALGGGNSTRIIATILRSDAFRSRLARQVNRAAEKGAEIAAPMVAETVRTIGIENAVDLVKGGPEAATLFLKDKMGPALLTAMVPGIDNGLRLFDSQIVTEGLRLATGIDFAVLRDDVTRKASDGIYRAMGREEAAIRANPGETNNPLLIGVFGLAKRV